MDVWWCGLSSEGFFHRVTASERVYQLGHLYNTKIHGDSTHLLAY